MLCYNFLGLGRILTRLIGVLGRFDSGDLAMIPAALGRVLGNVTPDVLPSRQHHCSVDRRRSPDVRCGVADRPPTMENGH